MCACTEADGTDIGAAYVERGGQTWPKRNVESHKHNHTHLHTRYYFEVLFYVKAPGQRSCELVRKRLFFPPLENQKKTKKRLALRAPKYKNAFEGGAYTIPVYEHRQ